MINSFGNLVILILLSFAKTPDTIAFLIHKEAHCGAIRSSAFLTNSNVFLSDYLILNIKNDYTTIFNSDLMVFLGKSFEPPAMLLFSMIFCCLVIFLELFFILRLQLKI